MPPRIVSLSLSEPVLEAARERARRLGYRSFSAYCEHVFAEDLASGDAHILRETPTPYRLTTKAASRSKPTRSGPAGSPAAVAAAALVEHEAERIAAASKPPSPRAPAPARRADPRSKPST